jgi:PAS domain S-box-containing protein
MAGRAVGNSGAEERSTAPTPDPVSGHRPRRLNIGAAVQIETLLESIITNAPTPIFMKDRGGSYLFVNAAYEQATGIRREETLGRTDFDIYPHAAAMLYRQSDLKAMQEGSALEFKQPAPKGDDARTFSVVKFPISDAGGKVLGTCGIALDITDSLRIEQSLTEERVRLDSLAGGTEDQDQQRRLIDARDYAGDAMQRLRLLMSDFRDTEQTSIELNRSLRRTLEAIEQEHLVTWSIDDQLEDPTLLLPGNLYRIAREALVNAARHANARNILVSLAELDDGIQLVITDDGLGFEERSTHTSWHIGLSSMRSRARSMGGSLQIHSPLGSGTRVEVWIPDPRQGEAPDGG